MYTTVAATILALTGSALSAPTWSDPTVCAPGTGYYQSCDNGYKGCSTTDMCSPWAPNPNDPTVCAPGTGYYQVCELTGFEGCSTKDECTPTALPKRWTCAPGTGYYQKCANGYEGCSTTDMCSPWAPSPNDPTVCAPGTGYYQVCHATGFQGCSTQDECTPQALPKRWTCAPGTGYYQKCSNGFDGCSKEDECSKKTVDTKDHHEENTPAVSDTDVDSDTPLVEVPSVWPIAADNGVCPPNTGYYQVCNGGAIKGCCKQDMCGLGYCPYPN